MACAISLLQEPTAEVPYIKGLLDPCTNNKASHATIHIVVGKRQHGLQAGYQHKD